MDFFSALVRKQAGRIGLGAILAINIAGGAAIYGIYAYKVESDLVDGLRQTALHMRDENGSMDKIKAYLDAEGARVEKAYEKNKTMLAKLEGQDQWLSGLPGSPTVAELRSDNDMKYRQAKERLGKERQGAGLVWTALTKPEEVPALKQGLNRENLEVYSSVKDCALRGAGEGAYCGPSAAVGVRLITVAAQLDEMRVGSEAYARSKLALGWDDWDAAEGKLAAAAYTEINAAQDKARAAFDKGDIDQEDWVAMQNGFGEAKRTASDQINQDRKDLQEQTYHGGINGYNWYLMSRWLSASPASLASRLVAHPYVAGGSAFAPTVASPGFAPSASKGQAMGSSASMIGTNIQAPKGANPYSVGSGLSRFGSKVNMSFAKAAGPKVGAAISAAGSSKGGLGSKTASYSAASGAAKAGGAAGHTSAGVGHSAGGHSSGGLGGPCRGGPMILILNTLLPLWVLHG